MKTSPYLVFNGNCLEAIALYEKAFKTKANFCQYKDAPTSEDFPVPQGAEEFVMHGILLIGNETIYLADTTPDQPAAFGNGSFACVELDSANRLLKFSKRAGRHSVRRRKHFGTSATPSLRTSSVLNGAL